MVQLKNKEESDVNREIKIIEEIIGELNELIK